MTETAQVLDDLITSEVVGNALAVAVEEASVVVVRSSHSTFIQEGADACAAILDASGQLVAQSMATSLMHGSSLRSCLPSLLEDVDIDDMVPGDVFVMNDPFRGGIHANDLVVLRPVFANDRPAFFVGTLIHVADLGGVAAAGLAALATDTFGEGMVVPPVRLYAGGALVTDIAAMLRRNSRAPDQVMGDISALVSGVNVAAKRLDELIETHGADRVDHLVESQLAYAETRMREELRSLPDGDYSGEFTIESDGVEEGRTFTVRATATIDDGSITVDLTATDDQSRGAINSSHSQTLSGVLYAVRCYIDPTIPMNDGCFRPLEVKLRHGSIVHPTSPAACGGRVVTVFAAVEAILAALSAARPERSVASSGTVHVFAMATPAGAENRWLTMLYEFGGIGARASSDGPDATGAFFLGGRSTIPQIEPLEAQYPLVVHEVSVRTDSGGPGKYRGGLGSQMILEPFEDVEVTVRGDRMILPPPGVDGGLSGVGGFSAVEHHDGTIEMHKPKQSGILVKAGEKLIFSTSGGGGHGSPLERDPRAVLDDVADNSVSPEAANDVYGVVITDGAVDTAATEARRAELAAARAAEVAR